ncbi:MAG: hypothetical protein AAGI44_13350, partial [Pseudomonadota bacterium]
MSDIEQELRNLAHEGGGYEGETIAKGADRIAALEQELEELRGQGYCSLQDSIRDFYNEAYEPHLSGALLTAEDLEHVLSALPAPAVEGGTDPDFLSELIAEVEEELREEAVLLQDDPDTPTEFVPLPGLIKLLESKYFPTPPTTAPGGQDREFPYQKHDETHVEFMVRTGALKGQVSDEQNQQYATNLARHMWQTFYRDKSPEWQPLDTLRGVLSQIDNMLAGLQDKHDVALSTPEKAVTDDPMFHQLRLLASCVGNYIA